MKQQTVIGKKSAAFLPSPFYTKHTSWESTEQRSFVYAVSNMPSPTSRPFTKIKRYSFNHLTNIFDT